ncbi:MAG: DUF4007 family protein [Planctomycetaceae bacterium]|nr:DUF4007 family protein [Planctomycetaceae bacterium]
MADCANPSRRYKFSGHQTFPFRYGWLEKGVRAVEECPTIFALEDAIVRLGVGKNMVESIKHWCTVTQLIDEAASAKNPGNRVSEMGKQLLLKWDPFLEDDASLWLIHWLLATNPRIGTTWQLVFGEFFRPDFSRRELVDYVLSFATRQSLKVNESSIGRDVDCFIRTYVAMNGHSKKNLAEDSFDCPFLALNLIQLCPDGELYRFSIGPKPSLPAAVVAFAIEEYFVRVQRDANTLSIQECLYGNDSPGQIFKLDENTLLEYVEEIEEMTHDLLVDETAGLKQIYRRKPLNVFSLLQHHYGLRGRE